MASAGRNRLDALQPHAERLVGIPFAELLAADPERATDLTLRVGPVHASFARQRIDREGLAALYGLAVDAGLAEAFARMFDGQIVNVSERRPALHTALRSSLGQADTAKAARAQVVDAHLKMRQVIERLEASDVTDIVSIGIGGSDLGPRLVVDALQTTEPGRFKVHFVANVDADEIDQVLAALDPAKTAALLTSKSFGTQETLLNGAILKRWLGDSSRLFAITANAERAIAFGVADDNLLPMWDWVGGRFSLWSTVGFPVALALGWDAFQALLDGAADMDAHVLEAPVERNLPILHALLSVWNRNGLGLPTHAIVSYAQRLDRLPDYLQQLVMESLGKSVTPDGDAVTSDTVPVLWGGIGSNVQHSFFQALHQGTQVVPLDFIGIVNPNHGHAASHNALLANLLAQAEALANGSAGDDPQKVYPGGRPSTLFLLDALTPQSLGALVALYEHSVYAQSILWRINPFDQWGVELGKRIAGDLLETIEGDSSTPAADPVTAALLQEIRLRSK